MFFKPLLYILFIKYIPFGPFYKTQLTNSQELRKLVDFVNSIKFVLNLYVLSKITPKALTLMTHSFLKRFYYL